MYSTFNLSFAEHDKCLIVFNYKVGSRFIQNALGNNIVQYDTPITITDDLIIDTEPQLKEWFKKITSPFYNRKIIILYRNPYEKLLSGFIEDFQEVALRPDNYIEDEVESFLRHSDKYDYNKTTLQLLKELSNSDSLFYNTQNTYMLFEKNSIHQKLSASTAYCNLIYHYINWRLDTNRVDERHSSYHCIPVYILLKEFFQPNEVTLVDIDNEKISLKNILQEYSKEEITSEKNHFSNDKVKQVVREYLLSKSMDEKIRRGIKYESIIYKLLKMDYRNYEKM